MDALSAALNEWRYQTPSISQQQPVLSQRKTLACMFDYNCPYH